MIPRLTTRPPLYFAPKMSTIGRLHRMGKPSPAERLRQRRKARSDAVRFFKLAYLAGEYHA